ncbi:MAG: DNA repair protein RecN [Pseudomonadota bacterium]
MLTQIHIKNFTIIETLELDLHAGMTVLTGETGAGKSILIDAIELAFGKRANANVVRQGEKRADISIFFDIQNAPALQNYLETNDLNNDSHECMVRRTIDREGRSKSYINGIPTSLQPLREIAEGLVNIHGQHEFQKLLKRDEQLELLDGFAKNDALLQELSELTKKWKQTRQAFEQLKASTENVQARADFLNYQIKELDELNLAENEIEKLTQEHKKLSHTDQLLQNAQLTFALLDENDSSVTNALSTVAHTLAPIKGLDPALSNTADLVDNALIQVTEAVLEIQHYLEHAEPDPEKLAHIENRLSLIHDIARKHHVKPEALHDLHQRMQEELNQLETSDQQLLTLEASIKEQEKQYAEVAKKLTQRRQKAAQTLSQSVSEKMQTLGMKGGKFEIAFESKESLSSKGMETVTFRVSANPGHALQPLAKIASGGELSRISLAIQVIAAKNTTTPTLIFDEVDVGIGGATAEVVGELLKTLGKESQILCITHLPQVAAKGDQHLKIEKKNDTKNTSVSMQYLETEPRMQEIARMLGGIKITEQTLSHAKEMLE